MFMRFRGGGVGHIGTRYLDSKLKDDNRDLDGERQDAGGGAEEDLGTYEEFTSRREPGNEEDEDNEEEDDHEDELEDEDEGEDEGSEPEALRNTTNEQDLDNEDDGILDGEGFAEL